MLQELLKFENLLISLNIEILEQDISYSNIEKSFNSKIIFKTNNFINVKNSLEYISYNSNDLNIYDIEKSNFNSNNFVLTVEFNY